MIPLINGEAYSWQQIVATVAGVPLAGISAIEYKDNQEMVDNYGAGSFVVSRGFGKYKAEAKITLQMEELEPIIAAAPQGRIQNIPEFDINITYLPLNGVIVTHKIRNCRFMNNPRTVKSGDTVIECELDILTSHIEWKQ